MMDDFKLIKNEIVSFVENSFNNYLKELDKLDKWGEDSLSRISEFIVRGKLIRGILVVAGYKALGGKEKDKILSVASSIELLHTGFLMHDDVMDQDEMRRGKPSIHIAYSDLFKKENLPDPGKNGESFAVCLGNIAYFLAFDFISGSGFEAETTNRLNRILNREAVLTGFGQMNDIYTAASDTIPDENTIINTYIMKTARYTFALPLQFGAVCCNIPEKTIEKLIGIGEKIGVIFQLRDDELNLFGEVSGTGKSVGSDISEGKKTLLFSMLMKKVSPKEKTELFDIFSKNILSKKDLGKIKTLVEDTGVLKKQRTIISEISKETATMIKELETPENYKNILRYILKLSSERSS